MARRPVVTARDVLSMAVGKTPADMKYDKNRDGKITSADALAYSKSAKGQIAERRYAKEQAQQRAAQEQAAKMGAKQNEYQRARAGIKPTPPPRQMPAPPSRAMPMPMPGGGRNQPIPPVAPPTPPRTPSGPVTPPRPEFTSPQLPFSKPSARGPFGRPTGTTTVSMMKKGGAVKKAAAKKAAAKKPVVKKAAAKKPVARKMAVKGRKK
jgi:histone H1/5